MIGANFVPQILQKGVAPDGREYDLLGFGHWLAEELSDDEQMNIIKTGTMNEAQIRSYWQWSNREEPAPSSLQVYLAKNPEFFDWVLLKKAFDFVSAKINRDKKFVESALRRAFAAGHIRTRGVHEYDARGNVTAIRQIEVRTRDLVKWLKYEFEIKSTVNQIASWPDDPLIADALDEKR